MQTGMAPEVGKYKAGSSCGSNTTGATRENRGATRYSVLLLCTKRLMLLQEQHPHLLLQLLQPRQRATTHGFDSLLLRLLRCASFWRWLSGGELPMKHAELTNNTRGRKKSQAARCINRARAGVVYGTGLGSCRGEAHCTIKIGALLPVRAR